MIHVTITIVSLCEYLYGQCVPGTRSCTLIQYSIMMEEEIATKVNFEYIKVGAFACLGIHQTMSEEPLQVMKEEFPNRAKW